jgi:hypothetical protein
MWFFIACNFINTSCGFFGGSSSLFISSHVHSSFIAHSLFFICSCSWLGHGDELLTKEAIVMLVVVITSVFEP